MRFVLRMSDSFTIFVRRLFFTIITVLWVSEFVSAMDPDGITSRPLNTTGARFNEQQTHNQQITPPNTHSNATDGSDVSSDNISTVTPWDKDDYSRHWYLKTNGVALVMLVVNIHCEIDLTKHWSATLPLYYSGWDYFKSTLKFRIFAVQPEFRYWFKPVKDGFFAGVHGGLCYYNYANGGAIRYQDHSTETPALGGGITIGYRARPHNRPLHIEFSIGAGIYHLDYDTFINKPDGLQTGRHRRTFLGIDNIGITLCYRFDIKQRKEAGQ